MNRLTNRPPQMFDIKPERISLIDALEVHPRAEAQRYLYLIRNNDELIKHIHINISTMGLEHCDPSWARFMETKYFHDLAKYYDIHQMAKYRAWWGLCLLISEGVKEWHKAEMMFAVALIRVEQYRRSYSTSLPLDASGLDEIRVAKIREYVLQNFESLASA